MPSLLDLQRRFAGALAGEAGAAAGGLAVYRDTVHANWRNALGATFAVVRELTGAPFFAAAVAAFAHAHPSRSGDLNVYGDAFPGFLAAWPHARDLPYLPDVARLEWAMDEAQRAADEDGTPDALVAAFAAVAPEAVAGRRLRLDASCRLLASPYPVLRIWQAHQDGGGRLEDVAFAGAHDRLLVRREGGQVTVERLAAGSYAWLAALAGGAPLGDALDAALAADPDFDIAAVLAQRVADRTLAALA